MLLLPELTDLLANEVVPWLNTRDVVPKVAT